jgi:hypothetical protein
MKMTSPTFANEESFSAYVKYLAFKRHFTTDSYDYFKYNGKVRASIDSFQSRNDSFFFLKLARKDDYENIILANMIEKPDIQKKISLETFTIMTHLANIFPYWDKKIVDKVVSRDIMKKSRKYKPFLDLDWNRYKTYVKDQFL